MTEHNLRAKKELPVAIAAFVAINVLTLLLTIGCSGDLASTPQTQQQSAADHRPSEEIRDLLNQRFPDLYRVSCLNTTVGCPCFVAPLEGLGSPATGGDPTVLARLYHTESVVGGELFGNMRFVVRQGYSAGVERGQSCYFPDDLLQKMDYHRILTVTEQTIDHTPVTADALAIGGATALARASKKDIGNFWATYYHLALETHHPGADVDVFDPDGRVIGRAPREFLDQVRWEGSGIMRDGSILQWAGQTNRYVIVRGPRWSYGAGYQYEVYPYRTFAANFPGICAQMRDVFPGRCGKREIMGLMVWIKEIADLKIELPGGAIHDGYFCITDTGSPHYIKEDRIDFFVGTHGGANPYLPPARRRNAFYDGGVRALVPADWRLWSADRTRVWCDKGRTVAGECTHDFRTVARDKALRIYALLDERGQPLRCNKRVE